MGDLFTSPVLRVEQPRGVPSARSRYKFFDGQGTLLARAAEREVPLHRQALRTVFGDGGAHRIVYVDDVHDTPLLVLEKPRAAQNTTGTRVSTPDGTLIGSVRLDRSSSVPFRFVLLDGAERPAGRLEGNRLGRKFQVLDGHGTHLAQLDKKWKGAATELLTTADRYSLEIFYSLPDPLRILVVAAPLAIDLMLYEGKDWPIG